MVVYEIEWYRMIYNNLECLGIWWMSNTLEYDVEWFRMFNAFEYDVEWFRISNAIECL